MRLVVHDFAGHPGQLQLSRELARRGHHVEHQYCASVTTGRGAVTTQDDDPETFAVQPIALNREFARYSPATRACQEIRYAWLTTRAVTSAGPDVAMFANVPIVALFLVTLTLRARRIPYVFWWQDVYGEAVGSIARRRLGKPGALLGWLVSQVERKVAENAAAIIPITDVFLLPLSRWGVDRSKIEVIPNWGPLDEVPSHPRRNPWATAHGLTDVTVVMYAGTLGLKHDPAAIAELACALPDHARLVVVSQGKGREWLEREHGSDSGLILLDYQPYEDLPKMLASADILLAVLEPDASHFSVPSKMLTYLCAGRPILALLPADNAVARLANETGAAIVVRPGDVTSAAAALDQLISTPTARERMGAAARRYAESAFDIVAIGTRFEEVLRRATDSRPHGKLNDTLLAISQMSVNNRARYAEQRSSR